MKNKEFFYLQYDKLKWENQEKTKINSFVNQFIIDQVIIKRRLPSVKIFDIGFGIGFFLRALGKGLQGRYKEIILEGCEPSYKNYKHFTSKPFTLKKNTQLRTFNKTFLKTFTETKFDIITSIYTFTAFVPEELVAATKKIHSMLAPKGQFVLVVAEEKYLDEKLSAKRDLFIEKSFITLGSKKYKEVLHYSEIPQIGTIIDYNREARFYLDLFKQQGFRLVTKKDLDDNGFVCTIFIFEKK